MCGKYQPLHHWRGWKHFWHQSVLVVCITGLIGQMNLCYWSPVLREVPGYHWGSYTYMYFHLQKFTWALLPILSLSWSSRVSYVRTNKRLKECIVSDIISCFFLCRFLAKSWTQTEWYFCLMCQVFLTVHHKKMVRFWSLCMWILHWIFNDRISYVAASLW